MADTEREDIAALRRDLSVCVEALLALVMKPPNRSKADIPASDGNGTLEDQIRRALGEAASLTPHPRPVREET